MAATILEQMRCTQEDLERIEEEMAEQLVEEPKNHKEVVDRSHKVKLLLDIHQTKRKALLDIYADQDGAMADEAGAMTGTGPSLYSAFYERLREAKAYHGKYPGLEVQAKVAYLPEEVEEVPFSAEERYGKHVDLNGFLTQYNNLPFRKGRPVAYEKYLELATRFSATNTSTGRLYIAYLRELKAYLLDFIRRSQPLYALDAAVASIESDFAEQWASGSFTTWGGGEEATVNEEETTEAQPETNAVAEAEDPLFCKYCRRRYARDTVFAAHEGGKKHRLAVERFEKEKRDIFELEYCVHRLGQIVGDELHATKLYVVAKFSKTYEEIQADLEAEEDYSDDEEEDDEDDEEDANHGIENYPVGFDGKPIPFWLYKLHGLGNEYKCEICGNTSYWGRRAFERHFSEARHSYGMRCLGVPNLPHFKEITGIKDVLALWEKLKKDRKTKEFNPDNEEEFEDSEGSVLVGKKTYELMARQNLL